MSASRARPAPRSWWRSTAATTHTKDRTFDFPAAQLGISPDTTIILVAGEADDVCSARQSADAADALEAAGYDTTLVTIAEANHYNSIFHDVVDGRWVTASDHPAGEQTVQTILDAIRAARTP